MKLPLNSHVGYFFPLNKQWLIIVLVMLFRLKNIISFFFFFFFFCYQYRTYDALRKVHDAQIVQIATEAGLRILPDKWSSLLYGDMDHKSHMQSIIDKVCC